jgi:hypothetical protein
MLTSIAAQACSSGQGLSQWQRSSTSARHNSARTDMSFRGVEQEAKHQQPAEAEASRSCSPARGLRPVEKGPRASFGRFSPQSHKGLRAFAHATDAAASRTTLFQQSRQRHDYANSCCMSFPRTAVCVNHNGTTKDGAGTRKAGGPVARARAFTCPWRCAVAR